MSPAEAYRATLRAQHPDRHAPGECPQREHVLRDVVPGWKEGAYCIACDSRLAPDAPLPPEVQAVVDAPARACMEAARKLGEPYACGTGTEQDPRRGAGALDVITAVERAARECGVEIT